MEVFGCSLDVPYIKLQSGKSLEALCVIASVRTGFSPSSLLHLECNILSDQLKLYLIRYNNQ